ncbi:hypothetical protein GA0115246_107081, partial [Streptomyces sp. SolWspMP-sol7th]
MTDQAAKEPAPRTGTARRALLGAAALGAGAAVVGLPGAAVA